MMITPENGISKPKKGAVLTIVKNDHQAVINAALSLPAPQRRRLAQLLAVDLPTELDDYTDAEWLAELDRRHAEFLRGVADAVPWPVVQKTIEKSD